jgi:hypothetical protein
MIKGIEEINIPRKPKYKLIKDDSHAHPDFHRYYIGEVFLNKEGKINLVSEPIKISAMSRWDVLNLLDDLTDCLWDEPISLKEIYE